MVEPKVVKKWRIVTTVEEITETTQMIVVEGEIAEETVLGEPELAAKIGHTIESPTFMEGLPQFNVELNKQWAKVAEMAPVIDGHEPV